MNDRSHAASRSEPDSPGSTQQNGDALIQVDRQVLRSSFNKHPFLFRHELADPPLFQNQRLHELAQSLPSRDVSLNAGDISIGDNWTPTTSNLEEAIAKVESSDAYVVLKRVEHDPEFRMLLDRGVRDLEDGLQRDIRGTTSQVEAFIFIASPGAVTPFHIDAECTFLFQIRGEKTFYVCDPEDRDMLPRPEIERFYYGSLDAATYKPEYHGGAQVYRLGPGMGVHLPVHAAHWVENDDNVSVALSISFVLPSDRARKRIYLANHYLRKFFGWDGSDPGGNVLWDAARSAAGGAAEKALAMRRALHLR